MKNIDFTKIKLLALDVDGVLTDGKLIINADGSESKCFNSLDGHGLKLWQRAGLKVAVISGRMSKPTECWAKELGISHVFQNCQYKLPIVKKLLGKISLSPSNVAFVGNDLMDIPVIRYVRFGVVVADAVDEAKQYANFVTSYSGGNGAVREVIEHVLKKSGRWEELMKRYLPQPSR